MADSCRQGNADHRWMAIVLALLALAALILPNFPWSTAFSKDSATSREDRDSEVAKIERDSQELAPWLEFYERVKALEAETSQLGTTSKREQLNAFHRGVALEAELIRSVSALKLKSRDEFQSSPATQDLVLQLIEAKTAWHAAAIQMEDKSQRQSQCVELQRRLRRQILRRETAREDIQVTEAEILKLSHSTDQSERRIVATSRAQRSVDAIIANAVRGTAP